MSQILSGLFWETDMLGLKRGPAEHRGPLLHSLSCVDFINRVFFTSTGLYGDELEFFLPNQLLILFVHTSAFVFRNSPI